MFSQRSIMIGFIILIVGCLVMYGCSSTSIKEGFGLKGAVVRGNIITYKGKDYQTITGQNPIPQNPCSTGRCENSNQQLIPEGWQIADGSAESKDIAASYPWGAEGLVFLGGNSVYTATSIIENGGNCGAAAASGYNEWQANCSPFCPGDELHSSGQLTTDGPPASPGTHAWVTSCDQFLLLSRPTSSSNTYPTYAPGYNMLPGAAVSGDIVSYNGKDYQTLTGLDPYGVNSNCESTDHAVPDGWGLAADTDDAASVITAFPWSSKKAVVINGSQYQTAPCGDTHTTGAERQISCRTLASGSGALLPSYKDGGKLSSVSVSPKHCDSVVLLSRQSAGGGNNNDGGGPPASGTCLPKSTSTEDAGYSDAYQGWYDVQGCGRCLDYCRWVGSEWDSDGDTPGGDPATKRVDGESYWSCRLAGGSEPYYPDRAVDAWPEGWTFTKCEHEGGDSKPSAPPPKCPAACRNCSGAQLSSENVPLVNGVCTNFCSNADKYPPNGYCGVNSYFQPGNGGVDCRGCATPPPSQNACVPGLELYSSDVHQESSIEACQQSCQEDSDCTWWSYIPQYVNGRNTSTAALCGDCSIGDCSILGNDYADTTVEQLRAEGGAAGTWNNTWYSIGGSKNCAPLGASTSGPPPSQNACVPGLDILAEGPGTSAPSAAACQQLCQEDSNCNWWSHYYNTVTRDDISQAGGNGGPGGCYLRDQKVEDGATGAPNVTIGGSKNCVLGAGGGGNPGGNRGGNQGNGGWQNNDGELSVGQGAVYVNVDGNSYEECYGNSCCSIYGGCCQACNTWCDGYWCGNYNNNPTGFSSIDLGDDSVYVNVAN